MELEKYWQLYNEYFTGPSGQQNLIFAGVCTILIVLLCIFVLGGTIKKAIVACCCSKKSKVGTTALIQDKENNFNDDSIQSGNFTDEMHYEMKLESIVDAPEHVALGDDKTRDNSRSRNQIEMPSIQKQTAKGNK